MTDIPTPQFPTDPRNVVRGINTDGTLNYEQVGIEEISFKGRFGAVVTSSSSNTIAIGDHYFSIDYDLDKFRLGDDVQITSLTDTDCYMWGEVIAKVTTVSPAQLRIYVDDISALVGTFSDWEIQVVARPKPGIEKDVSTTSINPVTMTTGTFTVTASKFFPPGGKLLIKALADRSVILLGRVKAYNGTSLVVEKIVTTATVSQAYTSWSIALLDAPQDAMPLYAIAGGRVRANTLDPQYDIDVLPCRVRDSTDTEDLVLSSTLTKKLDAAWVAGTNQGAQQQSANLSGTITSTVLNVAGTSTAFNTEMGVTLTDLAAQMTAWEYPVAYNNFAQRSIIASGAVVTLFEKSSNTAGATTAALGVTGATYKRGGVLTSQVGFHAIVLAKKDSDGSCDVISCSVVGNGAPDLPTGYTKYRCIAIAQTGPAVTQVLVYQPLLGIQSGTTSEVFHVDQNDPAFTKIPLDRVLFTLNTGTSPVASTTAAGFVELATSAETQTGTDATRAVTPASLASLSGTYTPTLTNVTNVAASTASICQYMRVGSVVTVSGRFQVDPTTVTTATELGISLPVASDFASALQCGGTAVSIATNIDAAGIAADLTNNRASVQWVTNNAANHVMCFTFTYLIV